jgi:Ca2+/Na+ antiporter
MPAFTLYVADLIAIGVLVFGLFLPRHRRPELVVAFLTANVGVLAVAAALTSTTIGAGLGLGLFGILSIIRLRSEEIAHHEIAYYFAALTLGLLGGLDSSASVVDLCLMIAVLLAIAVGDHPKVASPPQHQQILLDRAHTEQTSLTGHLESLLAATVVSTRVIRTDLVNDTTLVDVRFRRSEHTAVGAR